MAVAVDVSDRLGKPQLAGAFVVGKGFVKRRALANAGGELGGVIGGTISAVGDYIGTKTTATTDMPDFKGLAYLAVTEDRLVLFKANQGFRSPSVGQQLASLPRSEIQAAAFRSGYLSRLKLDLSDGATWEFEVQRVYRKLGVAVAEALGAHLT